VLPTESVAIAMKLMIEKDYSYLPIVDADEELIGMVSEQTLLRRYYHLTDKALLFSLHVKDCQSPAVTLSAEADIFDALPRLETAGAVIVLRDKKPIGIVTDFDSGQFFHRYSEGIMLCQDIEVSLRRHIEDVLPTLVSAN